MASLIDVRNLIKQKRQITASQLLQQLDITPGFLAVLLDDLIVRGKIARCESTAACQTECDGCGDRPLDVSYRWIDFDIDVVQIH